MKILITDKIMVTVLIESNAFHNCSCLSGLPAHTVLIVIHQRISKITRPILIMSNYSQSFKRQFLYWFCSFHNIFRSFNHIVTQESESKVVIRPYDTCKGRNYGQTVE